MPSYVSRRQRDFLGGLCSRSRFWTNFLALNLHGSFARSLPRPSSPS